MGGDKTKVAAIFLKLTPQLRHAHDVERSMLIISLIINRMQPNLISLWKNIPKNWENYEQWLKKKMTLRDCKSISEVIIPLDNDYECQDVVSKWASKD